MSKQDVALRSNINYGFEFRHQSYNSNKELTCVAGPFFINESLRMDFFDGIAQQVCNAVRQNVIYGHGRLYDKIFMRATGVCDPDNACSLLYAGKRK